MERAIIINMIDSGVIPEGSDIHEIKKLSQSYPYCSTFRVLLALASKEVDDLELRDAINLASLYVQDRSKLYEYVIRDGLRKRIEQNSEADSQTRSEDIDAKKADDPAESTIKEEGEEVSPKDQLDSGEEKIIKTDLLEDQIMAEAVMHLGELEMEAELERIPPQSESEPGEKIEKEEPNKENEKISFSGWLLNLDKSKKPEKEIINRFISEDRKISPAKKAFFSPSQMGKMSLMEDETFVTETLAKIYERQGDYKKAARAYKNLGLKYPEKRVYFAALQKKAEEKI